MDDKNGHIDVNTIRIQGFSGGKPHFFMYKVDWSWKYRLDYITQFDSYFLILSLGYFVSSFVQVTCKLLKHSELFL